MTPRRIERGANAAPGTSAQSAPDAGVADLAVVTSNGPEEDLAHHVGTGVSPTGNWVQVASPADSLGSALDSQMPMMTTYGGQPAITWIEGSDTRVPIWKSNAWSLLGTRGRAPRGARSARRSRCS